MGIVDPLGARHYLRPKFKNHKARGCPGPVFTAKTRLAGAACDDRTAATAGRFG